MKITNLWDNETIPHNTFRFPGGEVNVKIQRNPSWLINEVEITQRITKSDDIIEILIASDALRRSGATKVDLVIPYVPYARQDRVMTDGESLSLKVFCDLINNQKFNRVSVLDPHSDVAPALLENCNVVDNLEFVKWAFNRLPLSNIVAPDAGALKKIYKAAKVVDYFGDIVIGSKIRDVSTGQITGTDINIKPVGESCVIIDDICDGGRTFIELAKVLKSNGAKKVYLVVTHGIFSAGFTELGKNLDGVFVTNSYRDIDPKEYQNVCNVQQLKWY